MRWSAILANKNWSPRITKHQFTTTWSRSSFSCHFDVNEGFSLMMRHYSLNRGMDLNHKVKDSGANFQMKPKYRVRLVGGWLGPHLVTTNMMMKNNDESPHQFLSRFQVWTVLSGCNSISFFTRLLGIPVAKNWVWPGKCSSPLHGDSAPKNTWGRDGQTRTSVISTVVG